MWPRRTRAFCSAAMCCLVPHTARPPTSIMRRKHDKRNQSLWSGTVYPPPGHLSNMATQPPTLATTNFPHSGAKPPNPPLSLFTQSFIQLTLLVVLLKNQPTANILFSTLHLSPTHSFKSLTTNFPPMSAKLPLSSRYPFTLQTLHHNFSLQDLLPIVYSS